MSGDFYQLPPVPNSDYNDSGEFCFQSNLWPITFHHRINFDVIIRQSEPNFIKAVHKRAIGNISDDTDTCRFLKSLCRKLPQSMHTTHLFSRNIDADLLNNSKLEELSTPGKLYIAKTNSGPKTKLKKILAPYKLSFKIDCIVMLLKNLDGKLVNGLYGRVLEMDDNSITVRFDTINETHKIKRYHFTIYDCKRKTSIAQRS